jgi:hypothetical protein
MQSARRFVEEYLNKEVRFLEAAAIAFPSFSPEQAKAVVRVGSFGIGEKGIRHYFRSTGGL